MKSQTKLILILIALFVVIAAVYIVSGILNKIPDNPQGTVGNTSGNLLNGGVFCEDEDGTVFFANPYDEDSLYRMQADESDMKKIFYSGVSHINAGGNYLYFYVKNSSSESGLGFVRRVVGLYRCKKNGKDSETLNRDPACSLILIDNSIYLQHYDTQTNTSLWKISTDGKTSEVVSKEPINPCSYSDGYLYYTDTDKTLFLQRMNTSTDIAEVYIKHDMWNPICQGGYIYYMDIHNDYRLSRYSIADSNIEVLTTDRVELYNITDEYLYYQKSSPTEPALKRIALDGSNEEIISEGIYSGIYVTSHYIYCKEYGDVGRMYHIPVTGPATISEFSSAIIAGDEFRDDTEAE